jgi:hypothetical protein
MYLKYLLKYYSKRLIKGGVLLMVSAIAFAPITPTISPASPATVYAVTLFVDVSANPSSGPAPLNDVDLTATVSGTARGSITYKFDCTSNGSWERTVTTSSTSFTATDLCDYSLAGSYTAKVRVERGGLTFEGTTAILVTASPSLIVDLSANPSSGYAPLNDVDLTATVSGTATGDITYKFDCTSDGSWERIISTSSTSFTATNLCDYPNPGNYTASVRAERGGFAFQGTAAIMVLEAKTLFVDLSANPSSGYAPLNDVDLTAYVSGTATGNITYRFDCTSDGSWERTVTTSSNPYTAIDLCDYSSAGTYTARVRVERGGLSGQDSTETIVQEALTFRLNISTAPASGNAPLEDVDILATVSGTATGDITYKFDCTSDGSWERTVTTSSTSYTATDLCDYYSTGVYTVKVSAERGGLLIQGTINVVVGDVATLAVDFSTYPSSGSAPLYNVDLAVYVSGTATGNITYRFDCTNNGTWERTKTTSSTSYTATDLCNYYNPGNYTAKVRVERGGAYIEGTSTIFVTSQ